MARTFYFPNILRKVHIGFLSLFKDFQVAKFDSDGNIENMRDVPITFGHKGKYLSIAQKKSKRDFSLYLPRIAVMMTGLTATPEKNRGGHLTPICNYASGSTDTIEKLYGGVPYRINYTVTILSEHMDEMSQILEQILPAYVPYRTVTIKEFDFISSFTRDLPVNLTSTTPNFQDETIEDELKYVEFELEFEVDCTFYRPLLTSDIIKTIKVDLIDSSLAPDISGVGVTGFTYAVSGSEDDYIEEEDGWTDLI